MKAREAAANWKLCLRFCLGLGLWAGLCYGLYRSPYTPHLHTVEEVRLYVASYGAVAPLAYVLLYTLRPLLFFPSLLLNLSAGLLFGPGLGIAMVLAGGLGCATTCYLLGRYGGGSWLLRTFGGSWGQRLGGFMAGRGCFTKLLWLRTVPVFPYDPVSLLAGSLGLAYGPYAGATLLGMVPGAVAYNLLADGVGQGRFYLGLGVTVLAFGLPLLLWRHRQGGLLPKEGEAGGQPSPERRKLAMDSTIPDSREVEIKALLSQEDLDLLLGQQWLQELFQPGSGRVLHLVSTYYDTPQGSFRQAGVAYRVRSRGDGSFEATAKRSLRQSGGLSRRLELNQRVEGFTPLLTGFAQLGLGVDLAALAAAEGGVEPLFTVEVDRTIYYLKEGDCLLELAIDRGTISTPQGEREPVDEIELELLAGGEEELQAFYGRLAALVPLREEERSKYARGLALAGLSR